MASVESLELFKQMSLDPFKSKILVQDDVCMGGLVMVLSNCDSVVVQTALEILKRLVGWPELQSSIRDFIGIQNQLESLKSAFTSSADIRLLAEEIYLVLYSENDPISNLPSTEEISTTFSHLSIHQDKRKKKNCRRKSFFISDVGKARTIVLEITGLVDQDSVETCRNNLLTVKGVVSITFEFKKSRAIVRAKPDLQPRILAAAIARSLTMVAQQVIRHQDGTEELISFANSCTTEDSSMTHNDSTLMPDYPKFDELTAPGAMDVARVDSISSAVAEGSWRVLKTASLDVKMF